MVDGLNNSGNIPVKVVYKGTANSSKEVEAVMKAANNDEKCIGIITWMHTFSPAKMWIKGLQDLQKPLLHFHTQYNAEIPWETMDMDFMNLNQSAHGDIEFGHICTRMRVPRKVVCGYWKSEEAQKKIAVWARVAAGVADSREVRCLMFGMNMNNVAVTDGDRVEFEQRLGYHVDYYPVSSLMDYFKKVTDDEVCALVEEYKKEYTIKIDESGEEVYWQKVKNAAKAEIALRRVLKDEGATAFTTNFDDLGDADIDDPNFVGFDQIPGLASQRLMAEGIGFGAEGDWKTACLYRTLWFMSQGLPTGCSFLEDYTLNFAGDRSSCLQSHMLEVCPLVKHIAAKHPEGKFETLRDCTWEQLEEVKEEVGNEDYIRAKFVLGEKDRVLAVCDALEKGDYETVGKKMYETHEGLSKDYEVSCEELDFLNDIAKECGVTGSRIMGGGFGGCTINLVKDELYDNFIKTAKEKYRAKYGKEPKVYNVVIGDGSRKISD